MLETYGMRLRVEETGTNEQTSKHLSKRGPGAASCAWRGSLSAAAHARISCQAKELLLELGLGTSEKDLSAQTQGSQKYGWGSFAGKLSRSSAILERKSGTKKKLARAIQAGGPGRVVTGGSSLAAILLSTQKKHY